MDEYNAAVQNPRTAFSDPRLQNGSVKANGFGLPWPISGGFALTYELSAPQQKWAIRCFHKRIDGLEAQYKFIDEALRANPSSRFLDFQYQARGVNVGNTAFPLVVMEWASGTTLGQYIDQHYNDSSKVSKLLQEVLSLEAELRSRNWAHGDISAENVMVGPGGSLKLIDYDGMYVPGMNLGSGGELGNPGFQHPQRTASDFGPKMDSFAFILLTVALEAIQAQPTLYTKFQVEGLLFTSSDLRSPATSAVFKQLQGIPKVSKFAHDLSAICQSPCSSTPSLGDFIGGKNIPVPKPKPQATATTTAAPQYRGAHPVVDGRSFVQASKYSGNVVEIVGRVASVVRLTTKHGKPYVMVTFGTGKSTVRVYYWSELLNSRQSVSIPDQTLVGQWVSVVGLLDKPFHSARNGLSNVSISASPSTKLVKITQAEANLRLGMKTTGLGTESKTPNQAIRNIASQITGGRGTPTPSRTKPPSSPTPTTLNSAIKQQAAQISSSSPKSSPPPPNTPRTRSTPRPSSGCVLPMLLALSLSLIVVWLVSVLL